MKKIFILTSLIFLSFAPHVLADGFTALAPIPGLTQGVTSVVDSNTLSTFFNNLYKYLIGVAAILAVLQIIWAGLDIAFFHKDAVATIVDDKGKIYNAIFGLVLVLSPYLVFYIINPSILNLTLNLPPIVLGSTTNITQDTANTAKATCLSNGGTADQCQAAYDAYTQAANTSVPNSVPPESASGGTPLPPAPANGCSAPSGGSYLQTFACANADAAKKKITCLSGLTLQIPAPKITDVNGKSLDVSTTVYCSGKTAIFDQYSYYRSYTGLLIGTAVYVPRDAAAANAFGTACENDGGIQSEELTPTALAFLGSHTYQASLSTNGCSSDSGVIIDTSKGGGVVCFSVEKSCNPPN